MTQLLLSTVNSSDGIQIPSWLAAVFATAITSMLGATVLVLFKLALSVRELTTTVHAHHRSISILETNYLGELRSANSRMRAELYRKEHT